MTATTRTRSSARGTHSVADDPSDATSVISKCGVCKKTTSFRNKLQCGVCSHHFHASCAGLSHRQLKQYLSSGYTCAACSALAPTTPPGAKRLPEPGPTGMLSLVPTAVKSEDDGDICPVCDSECTCTQRVTRSLTGKKRRLPSDFEGEEVSRGRARARGGRYALKEPPAPLTSDDDSDDDEEEEEDEVVRGRRVRSSLRTRRKDKRTAAAEDAELSGHSSGAEGGTSTEVESSDVYGLTTDDEERTLMAEEERQIKLNGMDSDEEHNVAPVGAPILDPNEMDHVWSSEAEEALSSGIESDHTMDRKSAGRHSRSSERLRGLESLKKDKLVSIPKLQPHVCIRRNCKKKQRMEKESQMKCEGTVKETGTSMAAPASALSPQIIQTFLATRGIAVTPDYANELAANLASGLLRGGSVSSAWLPKGNRTPRQRNKDAQKLEALQAEAESQNLAKRHVRASEPSMVFPPMDAEDDDDDKALPIEDILDLKKAIEDEGAASKPASRLAKVPVGTFRRSRRISKPLLKLSKAVKSTLGVVPRSIHETLLGGYSTDSSAIEEKSSASSSLLSPLSGTSTGFGAAVEKKLASRKNIMEAMKMRSERMRKLLEMGIRDDSRHHELTLSSDSECECCECECEECQVLEKPHPHSDEDVRSMNKQRRAWSSRMSAPITTGCVDDSDIEDDYLFSVARHTNNTSSAVSQKQVSEPPAKHRKLSRSPLRHRLSAPGERPSPAFFKERPRITLNTDFGFHFNRRNSLPFADLSMLIHDPSNPPSACASPTNAFMFSPSLNPFGNGPVSASSVMEKLELEPPVMSDPVSPPPRLLRRRRSSVMGGLNNINFEKLLEGHEWTS